MGSINTDLLRLAVVYLHLIACCVAIGMVLISDIKMVKQLLSSEEPVADREHLKELQTVVFIALAGLWLSGLAIVGIDVAMKGWYVADKGYYLENPKLQAKVLVVLALTLNGIALHRRVLPWLQRAGSLLKLSFSQAVFAIFSGALSGVSWFYAAMLGVGRPLAWKYSLLQLLAAYPLLIGGGFFSMLTLITWCKYRQPAQQPNAFAPTQIFRHPRAPLDTAQAS